MGIRGKSLQSPQKSKMGSSDDAIKVAVRVRKLLTREDQSELYWHVENESTISSTECNKRAGTYQFDHVFDKEAKNQDVYEKIAFDVIDSAIDGYNSTIFAYGQTSSGKTHTMMGTTNDKGIIREAVEYIFDERERQEREREFGMRVSFMEIY